MNFIQNFLKPKKDIFYWANNHNDLNYDLLNIQIFMNIHYRIVNILNDWDYFVLDGYVLI